MIVDLIKAKPENVDLFTVKKKQQISSPPILDVRFSVHGSPYYTPERINGPLLTNREKVRVDAFF